MGSEAAEKEVERDTRMAEAMKGEEEEEAAVEVRGEGGEAVAMVVAGEDAMMTSRCVVGAGCSGEASDALAHSFSPRSWAVVIILQAQFVIFIICTIAITGLHSSWQLPQSDSGSAASDASQASPRGYTKHATSRIKKQETTIGQLALSGWASSQLVVLGGHVAALDLNLALRHALDRALLVGHELALSSGISIALRGSLALRSSLALALCH